jgi:nitronate monooxygenase
MVGDAVTALCRLVGIDVPVIQAPMGGGPSTVELAAAVSNEGALGRLDDATVAAGVALVEPIRRRLGLDPRPDVSSWAQPFDDQLAVVLEERPPVFSFTFAPLPAPAMSALAAAGIVTIGTATNAAEAVELERAGVDVVCAQGAEAGGHHGTWLGPSEASLIGTMALVPLVCDAVDVPVVAAGGIMDARGVAAALCLGAGAAQMGTAFMLCREAGTVPPHRRSLLSASETDVATTSEVTGRLARGVRNELMELLRGSAVPPYPVMNALTSELRRAAAAMDDPELMSLWCGQGVPLTKETSAAEIVREIATALATTRR